MSASSERGQKGEWTTLGGGAPAPGSPEEMALLQSLGTQQGSMLPASLATQQGSILPPMLGTQLSSTLPPTLGTQQGSNLATQLGSQHSSILDPPSRASAVAPRPGSQGMELRRRAHAVALQSSSQGLSLQQQGLLNVTSGPSSRPPHAQVLPPGMALEHPSSRLLQGQGLPQGQAPLGAPLDCPSGPSQQDLQNPDAQRQQLLHSLAALGTKGDSSTSLSPSLHAVVVPTLDASQVFAPNPALLRLPALAAAAVAGAPQRREGAFRELASARLLQLQLELAALEREGNPGQGMLAPEQRGGPRLGLAGLEQEGKPGPELAMPQELVPPALVAQDQSWLRELRDFQASPHQGVPTWGEGGKGGQILVSASAGASPRAAMGNTGLGQQMHSQMQAQRLGVLASERASHLATAETLLGSGVGDTDMRFLSQAPPSLPWGPMEGLRRGAPGQSPAETPLQDLIGRPTGLLGQVSPNLTHSAAAAWTEGSHQEAANTLQRQRHVQFLECQVPGGAEAGAKHETRRSRLRLGSGPAGCLEVAQGAEETFSSAEMPLLHQGLRGRRSDAHARTLEALPPQAAEFTPPTVAPFSATETVDRRKGTLRHEMLASAAHIGASWMRQEQGGHSGGAGGLEPEEQGRAMSEPLRHSSRGSTRAKRKAQEGRVLQAIAGMGSGSPSEEEKRQPRLALGNPSEEEKRQRRLALNRDAARRMRTRNAMRLEMLEKRTVELQGRIRETQQQQAHVEQTIEAVKAQSKSFEEALVALVSAVAVESSVIPSSLLGQIASLKSCLSHNGFQDMLASLGTADC